MESEVLGVPEIDILDRDEDFEGVTGGILGREGSARLMNCRGLKAAEPGDVLAGLRELPSGVDNANAGIYGTFGSGVRGGCGGNFGVSESSMIEEELIHFSSLSPPRGGDSGGNNRNKSAKWSLMNLDRE